MKYGRLAVAVGLTTGVVSAVGSIAFPSIVYPYPLTCSGGIFGGTCVSRGLLPQLIGAFGILLVFDSILSLMGPKKAFYGLTVVSILTVIFLVIGLSDVNGSFFWLTVLLALATSASSFLAARSKTGFTEQSNPMNLPVFG